MSFAVGFFFSKSVKYSSLLKRDKTVIFLICLGSEFQSLDTATSKLMFFAQIRRGLCTHYF